MIDVEQVARLADAARIELEPAALPQAAAELSAMLAFAATLLAVDVAGVEEWEPPLPPARALRDDVPRPSLPREAALALAPAAHEGYVRVPRTGDEG